MVIKKIKQIWKREDKKPEPSEKKPEKQEKRAFIRLEYPPSKRPKLIVEKYKMEVINVSERGLKFVNTKQIPMGKFVNGSIELSNNKSLKLSGTVVWSEGNEAGMLISGRIPQHIMEEQQAFIKKYRS